ncbi:MAG TPA: hypothetical protein HPP59_00825 [Deltaproteobacteria bacterium]|nr:hypothetical protein [Deltaproteobacteria bacterium]
MKDKKKDIGFNRRVKASWLKDALQLTAAGMPVDEIEETLKKKIAEENPGKETIRKVFIYLKRVWIEPPDYCRNLRDDALEMFRRQPGADRSFLLNWGMCLAAYPFIAHVAEATGRLLRLQGEAQASQVNLRIRENFGDRHFVYRSVRYNLSTFLDAGALKSGRNTGTYMKDKTYRPKSDKEISWLVESLLHAQDTTTLPFQRIPEHGALFPFNLDDLTISALTTNPRIEIFRHGMNEQLIGLAK